MFSRNPDLTLRQGQAKLKQKGLDISYDTIRTYLKVNNMKWCNHADRPRSYLTYCIYDSM